VYILGLASIGRCVILLYIQSLLLPIFVVVADGKLPPSHLRRGTRVTIPRERLSTTKRMKMEQSFVYLHILSPCSFKYEVRSGRRVSHLLDALSLDLNTSHEATPSLFSVTASCTCIRFSLLSYDSSLIGA
jgi:hypothetical protein